MRKNNRLFCESMRIVGYKLSLEAFGIMSCLVFVYFVSELLLPGILSSHVDFFQITLVSLSLFLLSFAVHPPSRQKEEQSTWEPSQKTLLFLVFLLTLFIVGLPDKLTLGMWFFLWGITFFSFLSIMFMIFSSHSKKLCSFESLSDFWGWKK